MNTKQEEVSRVVTLGEEGRQGLLTGVQKLAVAVKSTLGPAGQTVLIESINSIAGNFATKDGVSVADEFFLSDPVENIGAQLAKQASKKTEKTADDGTTTSIVLMEALMIRGNEMIKAGRSKNIVLNELRKFTEMASEKLLSMSSEVTSDIILSTAITSVNNDVATGKMIADLYNEMGNDAIVEVMDSKSDETYSEKIEGLRLARGYSSELFVNKEKSMTREMSDVRILITDTEINKADDILRILEEFVINPQAPAAKLQSLLIIADCSSQFEGTMLTNYERKIIDICIVPAPANGYRKKELLNDLAIATGSVYFSELKGDNLDLMNLEDLGHADNVLVKKNYTTISISKDKKPVVNEKIEALKGLVELEESKEGSGSKKFLLERIANLQGRIGVIYAGGKTRTEKKELYDRIVDGIGGVRSAIKEGVLPGGGVALASLATDVSWAGKIKTKEQQIAMKILTDAIAVPLMQILDNAGITFEESYGTMRATQGEIFNGSLTESGQGYNVVTGEFGNMVEMGVADPTLVTRSALENSVSVAITLLGTNCIITYERI